MDTAINTGAVNVLFKVTGTAYPHFLDRLQYNPSLKIISDDFEQARDIHHLSIEGDEFPPEWEGKHVRGRFVNDGTNRINFSLDSDPIPVVEHEVTMDELVAKANAMFANENA